jgi:NAD(P)H-dependent FMN reductase
MITVISGTARPDSMTRRVAKHYYHLLEEQGEDVRFLHLEELPVWTRGPELLQVEQELLIPAEKFVIVAPEYNGSIPGMLKLLLDNSDIKKVWWGKKALLTGIADGRAGNLRGLDHLTNILHYLRVSVYWNKLPLSRIGTEFNRDGHPMQPTTTAAIAEQVEGFLNF